MKNSKVEGTNNLRAKRTEIFMYPLLFVHLLSLGREVLVKPPLNTSLKRDICKKNLPVYNCV